MTRRTSILAALLSIVLLGACAPATPSSAPADRDAPSGLQRGAKVLTIVGAEGNVGDFPGVSGGSTASGWDFVHAYLVERNDRDEFVPSLAAEQLSVDRGTWRINSDGSMDTTWRLRPNVKWHDGTPFTSDDLMFTFMAFMDPELPSRYSEVLRVMESASAPDPLTFEVHWTRPNAQANEAPALNPMPRHLLEDNYRNDKANFGNSPRLSTEFVGLGAYRMVRWVQGTEIQFERFDDYFEGRPPLDRVIVKFIADPNAVVANMLSGTADVAWGDRVPLESAVEVRQRWQGTGNEVQFLPIADLMQVEIQYRPDVARPRNGLPNRTVRQALYQAIDRQGMVDAVMHGLAPLADSWYGPNHVLRPQLQEVIPQYPYDPARAQHLLAEAGWVRGADGVLVDQRSGERFEIQLSVMEPKDERQQAIVADHWKALGAVVSFWTFVKPRDRELEALQPGGVLASPKAYEIPYNSRIYSGNISTAANRWTGRDRGGYSNPAVDATLERLAVTIDPRETLALHRQLVQQAMGDIAMMTMYFDVNPVLILNGVKGPVGGTQLEWNFPVWDKA